MEAAWFAIITQWHSWGSGKDCLSSFSRPPACLVISKRAEWDLTYSRYQDGTTGGTSKELRHRIHRRADRGKWTGGRRFP